MLLVLPKPSLLCYQFWENNGTNSTKGKLIYIYKGDYENDENDYMKKTLHLFECSNLVTHFQHQRVITIDPKCHLAYCLLNKETHLTIT